VKKNINEPLTFAALLAILLLIRLAFRARKSAAPTASQKSVTRSQVA